MSLRQAIIAGKLCKINTWVDNWMDADARPFICTTCRIVKLTKAGLIHVEMADNPKRRYSFPRKNVDVLEDSTVVAHGKGD